jgi:hypothetical protein
VLVCRDCGHPRESNERICPDCGADGWIAGHLRARLAKRAPRRGTARVHPERHETHRVFNCAVPDSQVAEALDYFDEMDWSDVDRHVVELQMTAEPGKLSRVERVVRIASVLVLALALYLWITIRHSHEVRRLDGTDWGFLALAVLVVSMAVAGAKRIAARYARAQFAPSLRELCERFYPMALSVPHPERSGAPKVSALFAPALPLVPPPVWAAYRSAQETAEGEDEAPDRGSGDSRCPHCGHKLASPEERPLVCGWCGRGLRSLEDVHRLWWSVRSTLGLPEVELENARESRRPGASPRVVDVEVDLRLAPPGRATFRTTAIKVDGHWFLMSPEPGDKVTETDSVADA